MTRNIDDVDWSSLRDCYGPALALPEALRGLRSNDEAIRTDAFSVLQSNVWHQGDLYEVTPHVVPFLLDLAEDDEDLIEYLCVVAHSACAYQESDRQDERALGVAAMAAFMDQLSQILKWARTDPKAVLFAAHLPSARDRTVPRGPGAHRLQADLCVHSEIGLRRAGFAGNER